jgi:hypothetical protein
VVKRIGPWLAIAVLAFALAAAVSESRRFRATIFITFTARSTRRSIRCIRTARGSTFWAIASTCADFRIRR